MSSRCDAEALSYRPHAEYAVLLPGTRLPCPGCLPHGAESAFSLPESPSLPRSLPHGGGKRAGHPKFFRAAFVRWENSVPEKAKSYFCRRLRA